MLNLLKLSLWQAWSVIAVVLCAFASHASDVSVENAEDFETIAGSGKYRIAFTYTGQNWTHADVAAVNISTDKPIAIIPMQYTEAGGMQPGAMVDGKHVGITWNRITQFELAQRLSAMGFYVLTPTIQMYGENLAGFQGFEHFIAGVHKGNKHVQTVLLTADADVPSETNPYPGAQMLVTGLHKRNLDWESMIQSHVAPFYAEQDLRNIGPRVRGGLSDVEGAGKAWHPLIERAAEYGSTVAILEAAQAVEIVEKAGSIENGRQWAGPLFDAIAAGMALWACEKKFKLKGCSS